jgi:hypothetical protein
VDDDRASHHDASPLESLCCSAHPLRRCASAASRLAGRTDRRCRPPTVRRAGVRAPRPTGPEPEAPHRTTRLRAIGIDLSQSVGVSIARRQPANDSFISSRPSPGSSALVSSNVSAPAWTVGKRRGRSWGAHGRPSAPQTSSERSRCQPGRRARRFPRRRGPREPVSKTPWTQRTKIGWKSGLMSWRNWCHGKRTVPGASV